MNRALAAVLVTMLIYGAPVSAADQPPPPATGAVPVVGPATAIPSPPTSAVAYTSNAQTEGDYTYAINDGQATITAFRQDYAGELTIPNTLGGKPVVGIGDSAFSSCRKLTSVTIPDTVTCIGDHAFKGCRSLTSVSIPAGVTRIGDDAFNDCSGLTSVVIPAGVTRIGDGAFIACRRLTSVSVPASVTSIGNRAFASCSDLLAIIVVPANEAYCSLDGALFDMDQTTLLLYPGGRTGNYAIPAGVTRIGDDAFRGCRRLISISVPASVTSIGDNAFASCSDLLAIIVVPANEAYCSLDGVLFNKYQVTLLLYPGGRTGNYAIPAGVTRIEDDAFKGCSGLTSILIPDSVTSIGDDAFNGCSGLTSVSIPASVNRIGDNIFDGCRSLTRAQLPGTISSIGNCAFSRTDLASIIIPASVTSIGRYAFSYCASLTGVFFEGNAPSIGTDIFKNTDKATIHYQAGTTGWTKEFGGLPTTVWHPSESTPRMTGPLSNGETLVVVQDLRRTGAFGFPQTEAQLLCDQDDLRVSAWNDARHLFVQAILWEDGDDSLSEPSGRRQIGDWSVLSLDIDADQKETPNVDRQYMLNPWPRLPGLRYTVALGGRDTTTIKGDSMGRGAIRYAREGEDKCVRVDTYAIPLDEIGKKAGQTIRLAYWASSPNPKLTLNSVGYTSSGAYNSVHLPEEKYHVVDLAARTATLDILDIPEGREDKAQSPTRPPAALPPPPGPPGSTVSPVASSETASRAEQLRRAILNRMEKLQPPQGARRVSSTTDGAAALPPPPPPPSSSAKGSLQHTNIHSAARHGDVAAVERILKENPKSLDARTRNRQTPLGIAAEEGQDQVVRLLVEKGADVEARNSDGLTPLHLAVRGQRIAAVAALLDGGANPNAVLDVLMVKWRPYVFEKCITPLHLAVQCPEITGLLIAHGADVEAVDGDSLTPLYLAARGRCRAVAEILMEKGSRIRDPRTAAALGDLEKVKALITQGADVNGRDRRGFTALHGAAACGSVTVARFLLEQGANVNALAFEDETPLEWALQGEDAGSDRDQEGRVAVAELLRQHGGRVLPPLQKESPAFPVSPGTSKPAIHTAASNGDRAEVERLLTENMELLKARDPEGLTPLQCAVRAGSREVADLLRSKGARIEDLRTAVALGELETIKELLKLGAPVNEQDSKGVTPLHTACIYGQVAAAELLLDAGARPNAASWGRDGGPRLPLVHAVSLGQVEMVDLLLMRGATVWADNPLYLAADRGFVEIAERLVTAGADVNVLYAAVSSDRLDMVKFLIAHGADVNTRSRSITPLWQATLTGSEEIVEVLLAAGAEVNTTLSEQQIAGGGVADIFWSLPLHGVTASGKYSPLHVAVWLGHRAIAQRLLAHGATPDIPIATGLGDLEAVAAYLAAGNDLNRLVEPGRMPLLSWARTREVVEWLIGHGADVNARGAAGRLRGRSEGGYTALHEAVKRGDAAMVTVLLEKGADVNAISYEDRTPLELALLESKGENKERVERREAVAELLRQHGGRVLPP